MKKKYILLALVIYIIFPFSGVLMKYAAMNENMLYKLLLFASSITVLGIFSILWQILLKNVDLVKAYIFKATSIIWTVIYGIILFDEKITIQMIIGIAIVLLGTIVAILGQNTETDNKKIGE